MLHEKIKDAFAAIARMSSGFFVTWLTGTMYCLL